MSSRLVPVHLPTFVPDHVVMGSPCQLSSNSAGTLHHCRIGLIFSTFCRVAVLRITLSATLSRSAHHGLTAMSLVTQPSKLTLRFLLAFLWYKISIHQF